jgi:hypothetical protein
MSKKKGRKTVYLGLNEKGRISWYDPINRTCLAYARYGIAIQTIAEWTHLTPSQVMYRLRKMGMSVLDYRKGTSEQAKVVHDRYQKQLRRAWAS